MKSNEEEILVFEENFKRLMDTVYYEKTMHGFQKEVFATV